MNNANLPKEVAEAITGKVKEPYEKTGITRDRRKKWLEGRLGEVAVMNLAREAGYKPVRLFLTQNEYDKLSLASSVVDCPITDVIMVAIRAYLEMPHMKVVFEKKQNLEK